MSWRRGETPSHAYLRRFSSSPREILILARFSINSPLHHVTINCGSIISQTSLAAEAYEQVGLVMALTNSDQSLQGAWVNYWDVQGVYHNEAYACR